MQRILDRLILSDLSEANDPFFLEAHKVESVLYFGEGGMFPSDLKLYNRRCEGDGSLSPEQLSDGIDFLRESLRTGRRVLAVGRTGATIVAAYLAEMGFSSSQAVEMLTAANGSPAPDAPALDSHARELERRRTTTVHG